RRWCGWGARRRLLAVAPAGRAARGRARARSWRSRDRRGDHRGMSNGDCLFSRLVRAGGHVAKTDGFVAIRDINPKAETHLLVLPERHVDTFKEGTDLPPADATRVL